MTKVQVSDDALADLNDGHLFYEAQEAGLAIISRRASGPILRDLRCRRAFIPSCIEIIIGY